MIIKNLYKSEENETLYLVTIYDKSEEAIIAKQELEELVKRHLNEEPSGKLV